MKYKVTVGTLFVAGQKYRRGDVIDLDAKAAETMGTNLEPVVEVEAPKPKRTRKPKVEKADAEDK